MQRRVITGNQIDSSANHLNSNLFDSGKSQRYVVRPILGVDSYILWMSKAGCKDFQKIMTTDARSMYNILATLRRANDVMDGIDLSEGLYVRQEA